MNRSDTCRKSQAISSTDCSQTSAFSAPERSQFANTAALTNAEASPALPPVIEEKSPVLIAFEAV
jgi:hypothetical protein